MIQKEKLSQKGGGIIIMLGMLIAIIALCLFVFEIPGFWAQLLAIIASAFLGAGATSWMTSRLLDRQQAAEEEKEKNIQIHQSKIASYTNFIGQMYSILNKESIVSEDISNLRLAIFKDLVFYIEPETMVSITDVLKDVEKEKIIENGDELVKRFSIITKALRHELFDYESDKLNNSLERMWQSLDPEKYFLQTEQSIKDNNLMIDHTTEAKDVEQLSSIIQYDQAWHFAMWGDQQLEAIGEGTINELSLIEYEEDWRTNLIKQVQANDVVFLFRRGGYGYIGAFRPLGWRVFDYDYDENNNPTCKETIHMFGQEERVITEQSLLENDMKTYDIYNGIENNADVCANLIVKPLFYIGKEAGTNPGGTYRRTISRYDAGYAASLMEWFSQNA